jgi:hypothetical protein
VIGGDRVVLIKGVLETNTEEGVGVNKDMLGVEPDPIREGRTNKFQHHVVEEQVDSDTGQDSPPYIWEAESRRWCLVHRTDNGLDFNLPTPKLWDRNGRLVCFIATISLPDMRSQSGKRGSGSRYTKENL